MRAGDQLEGTAYESGLRKGNALGVKSGWQKRIVKVSDSLERTRGDQGASIESMPTSRQLSSQSTALISFWLKYGGLPERCNGHSQRASLESVHARYLFFESWHVPIQFDLHALVSEN